MAHPVHFLRVVLRKAAMWGGLASGLLSASSAGATVPVPCPQPYAAVAAAPVDEGRPAVGLWPSEGEAFSLTWYDSDGSEVEFQIDSHPSDRSAVLRPRERIEAGTHVLDYTGPCFEDGVALSLAFEEAPPPPSNVGELQAEHHASGCYRGIVSVSLALTPGLVPHRTFLDIQLLDDANQILARSVGLACSTDGLCALERIRDLCLGDIEYGYALAPGPHRFRAEAQLLDGPLLSPASADVDVQCVDGVDCPLPDPDPHDVALGPRSPREANATGSSCRMNAAEPGDSPMGGAFLLLIGARRLLRRREPLERIHH